MKSKQLSKNTHLIRLYKGDEIVSSLLEFSKSHSKRFISFSGIGAISKADLSFFDLNNKSYVNKTLDSDFEILSLTGNISTAGNESVVHAHITLSDKSFSTFGGHLKTALISVTAEIIAQVHEKEIIRLKDKETRLNLIDMEEHGSSQPI
jgi:predicted DNA-binding protein with PD1-like motif